jgi:hypothetical protein
LAADDKITANETMKTMSTTNAAVTLPAREFAQIESEAVDEFESTSVVTS